MPRSLLRGQKLQRNTAGLTPAELKLPLVETKHLLCLPNACHRVILTSRMSLHSMNGCSGILIPPQTATQGTNLLPHYPARKKEEKALQEKLWVSIRLQTKARSQSLSFFSSGASTEPSSGYLSSERPPNASQQECVCAIPCGLYPMKRRLAGAAES